MGTKEFEILVINLTKSENGNSIIHYINDEEKRIIFCLSKWSLINGIFTDEDKWKYDILEINKRTNSNLIFLLEDLISRYPDYTINLLKIE